jgi:hypothetical protein
MQGSILMKLAEVSMSPLLDGLLINFALALSSLSACRLLIY